MGIKKGSIYYETKDGKPGRKPTKETARKDNSLADNKEVIEKIEELISKPYVSYGYRKVCHWLKRYYVINHKKVFRLMKESRLLKKKTKKRISRTFVKHFKARAERPFENMQMDIKYIYVPELKSNVYLLSVIDVCSRKVLGYSITRSCNKRDVIKLLKEIQKEIDISNSIMRTDNGPQFIAKELREYVNSTGMIHEFTHAATPEENAYIESFHKTLEEDLLCRIEYYSFEELEKEVKKYIEFYNKERIHSSLGYMSPDEFLENHC